jgi:hypothetical protein
MRGVRGKSEEHAKLTEAQFGLLSDTIGDSYYVGPYSRIVWLFDDGTWRSYPDSKHDDLDSYLEELKALPQEI